MSWLLPPLTPHFHAALRDVHAQAPDARMRAAQRLSMAVDDELERALTALSTLSTDAHPQVRATAVAGLGELAHESSLDAVLSRIDDPSAQVRELAIVAVGRIGGERARDAIVRALASEAAEVRFQAVAALAELCPAEAIDDVLPLIDDADPQVRAQVAETLGRLGAPHTRGHLAGLLDDPDPAVGLEAAIALAHQEDARGELKLVAALRQRHRLHDVCLALSSVAGEPGRAALADLAGRLLTPATQRAAAGAALASRGDAQGLSALRRVLRGFNGTARTYAVELIGLLGIDALVPELTQLSRRPRGADPYLLVEALTRLAARGANVGEALNALALRQDAAGQAARDWLQPREPQDQESQTTPN